MDTKTYPLSVLDGLLEKPKNGLSSKVLACIATRNEFNSDQQKQDIATLLAEVQRLEAVEKKGKYLAQRIGEELLAGNYRVAEAHLRQAGWVPSVDNPS